MSAWRRIATGAAATLAALTLPVAAAPVTSPPHFWGPTLKHPAAPPDFALRDQHGHLIRLSGQRGKVVLVTFLYTHCPDLCPLTASNINAALGLLGGHAPAIAVAVSVDPRGDTAAAVRRFVRSHGLGSRFHYLTGTKAALTPVWRAYRVTAGQQGANVDHTLYTLLVDRTGKARVLFDSSATARTLAHDARLLL